MKTTGFNVATTLALTGVALIAAPHAAAQVPPQTYEISATLRDFTRNHPDMGLVATSIGHHHGNVALDVNSSGKPSFTGGGFLASITWRDSHNNAISPHLFNTCAFLTPIIVDPGPGGGGDDGESSFMLTVSEKVRVERRSMVDSFDSNDGVYGEGNQGSAAMVMVNGDNRRSRYVRVRDRSTIHGDVMVHPDDDVKRAVRVSKKSEVTGRIDNLETAVEIAEVEVPEMDLPESLGRVKHKGGEHVITETVRYDRMELDRRAQLTITGDVTLVVDRTLEVDNRSVLKIDGDVTIMCRKLEVDDKSSVELMEGASLTIFATRRVEVDDASMLNMNTGNPQLVRIMIPRHEDWNGRVELDDKSEMAAWVHGPDTKLKVDDESEFFGSFMGRKVKVRDGSKLHVDTATVKGDVTNEGGDGDVVIYQPESCELGDVPGSPGPLSDGDVLSAGTFDEWWNDILGVNMSTVYPITMWRLNNGEYIFHMDDWRPLDGQLLGNEGEVHNFHFTAELDTEFNHVQGNGDFFELRNTDDSFVFVNGRLVIDNGGFGFNKVMYVDMDRLGLPDGEPARLQVFHAQRQQGLAIFAIRTSLVLTDATAGVGSVTGVLDD